MSKLNVIVAVKNMANDENLTKGLDSLVNQTYDDLKVLVVDDCSMDKTPEIIKEYANKNPDRIKVFLMDEEFGLGGAKNKGLIEADSEWIGFVNLKDTIKEDYFEVLMKKALSGDTDVVGSLTTYLKDGEIIDKDNLDPLELEVPKEEMIPFLLINPGILEGKIYKKSIFDINGLWFPTSLRYENIGLQRLILTYATNYVYTDETEYIVNIKKSEDVENGIFDRVDVMTFFIEETYKREIISEYPEEIEEVYLEEMYINTLLLYMKAVPSNKWKLSVFNYLREGIMECFPEYDTNPYYWEKYDDEVKDMLELHCKNPKKFMNQYKSAWRGN